MASASSLELLSVQLQRLTRVLTSTSQSTASSFHLIAIHSDQMPGLRLRVVPFSRSIEDPDKMRRRGHWKDCNYDNLMDKWCTIWNVMLGKHCQFIVDGGEGKIDQGLEESRANKNTLAGTWLVCEAYITSAVIVYMLGLDSGNHMRASSLGKWWSAAGEALTHADRLPKKQLAL